MRYEQGKNCKDLFDAFRDFTQQVDNAKKQGPYKSLEAIYIGDDIGDSDEAYFWVGRKGRASCDLIDPQRFEIWLKQQGETV